jgi:hypothetical protein
VEGRESKEPIHGKRSNYLEGCSFRAPCTVNRTRGGEVTNKELIQKVYLHGLLIRKLKNLAFEWRLSKAYSYEGENADYYRGFNASLLSCAKDIERLLIECEDK